MPRTTRQSVRTTCNITITASQLQELIKHHLRRKMAAPGQYAFYFDWSVSTDEDGTDAPFLNLEIEHDHPVLDPRVTLWDDSWFDEILDDLLDT
jgi:hypothetical protein